MSEVNEIVEARRKGFEEWCERNWLSTLRDGVVTYYAYKSTEDAWDAWNAALDSACVELPVLSCAMFETSRDCAAAREGMDIARLAIERAGLKVKP